MITSPQIAWLTGLLEGEGSFVMSGRAITIALSMTDRDVVERAASLSGGRVYDGSLGHLHGRRKPQFRTYLKGRAPPAG